MLVQIRDREYLQTQRNVHPNVAREMYQYAGDTFEIDDDLIYESRTYEYMGFAWLGKWLFDTQLMPPTTPRPFTLETTNLPLYIDCLKNLIMPEKLQHIRIVSNHFPADKTIPIINSITGVVYDLRLERIIDGHRIPDPSMYIKFSGATEYNTTKYMAYATIGRPVSMYDDRQYEQDVKVVVDQLGIATQRYLAKIKDHNVYFNKDGFRAFGLLHYQAQSSNVDTLYVPLFLGTAMKAYSTYIDSLPLTRIHDKTDKDLIYYGGPSTFHSIKQEDYDTYFYNQELRECPIFGVKFFGRDPISSYFRIGYSSRGPVLLSNIHDNELVWNTYYERLHNSGHPWSKLQRGYIWRGQIFDKAGLDAIIERYKKFNKYGLTINSDSYEYAGSRYYFNDDIINEYDYEPYIEFYGDTDDLHLGVELEIDGGGEDHDNAGMITSPMWKEVYAMHDGSLNEGFEIATMPMTLNYFEEHKQEFNDMFGIARLLDYRSHNTSTCGLHIHFDRSFFGRDYRTQNTKASYLALIMERNWEKFVQFSRRRYSRMEDWAKKMDLVNDIYADDNDDDAMVKFNGKYGNGDKYIALNTSHSHTYELRIFRGTLKLETFYATLQFVDNLVRVAKECPSLAKAQQITFADIIDYKHHKELIEYVNTRGILTREYKEYEEE